MLRSVFRNRQSRRNRRNRPDRRSRRACPQKKEPLLPELCEADNCVARRILRHIRRRGKCNMEDLAAHVGHTAGAEGRRRIVTALVESGQLKCSGKPGEFGAEYYI